MTEQEKRDEFMKVKGMLDACLLYRAIAIREDSIGKLVRGMSKDAQFLADLHMGQMIEFGPNYRWPRTRIVNGILRLVD